MIEQKRCHMCHELFDVETEHVMLEATYHKTDREWSTNHALHVSCWSDMSACVENPYE
jgi:hypothetical protein